MKVRLQVGKKGKWLVEPPTGTNPPEHELRDLAHMLREIPGVKRSVVRGRSIYLRIHEGVPKLRERVVRTAKRFFQNRYASLAATTPVVPVKKRKAPYYRGNRRRRSNGYMLTA